jgi:hypothetical protein
MAFYSSATKAIPARKNMVNNWLRRQRGSSSRRQAVSNPAQISPGEQETFRLSGHLALLERHESLTRRPRARSRMQEAQMFIYAICCLDGSGHVFRTRAAVCQSDMAAFQEARKDRGSHEIEIWQAHAWFRASNRTTSMWRTPCSA